MAKNRVIGYVDIDIGCNIRNGMPFQHFFDVRTGHAPVADKPDHMLSSSLKNGNDLSLSEIIGSCTGHSTPISGSFQRMPASRTGSYSSVHLYNKWASSDRATKPCAKPGGMNSMR